ncbi:MAG: stage 0 sporulation family protein [Turicibacter sp.]|nr:stage 0 sporulation family protein [Turicibacter sp.]
MEVVGVRFRKVGKVYYFNPCGRNLAVDTPVIVETVRGMEFGIIAIPNRNINNLPIAVKPILRIATAEDLEKEEQNKEKEQEAMGICATTIKEYGLEMRLVDVEITFDLNKVIFYFTAEGRVDFRELVKGLALIFRMRIELRQIGVRDEAKLIGGMGICGCSLCCSTFLEEFHPVSLKMAKEQGLSLNPTKISGACGRLMCCLKYEEETYAQLGKNMPSIGSCVRTPDGDGEVVSLNILRQTAKVKMDKNFKLDTPVIESYEITEIEVLKSCGKCTKNAKKSGTSA